MDKYRAVLKAIEEFAWTTPDTEFYMELVYGGYTDFGMYMAIIRKMKEEELAVTDEHKHDIEEFCKRVFELINQK